MGKVGKGASSRETPRLHPPVKLRKALSCEIAAKAPCTLHYDALPLPPLTATPLVVSAADTAWRKQGGQGATKSKKKKGQKGLLPPLPLPSSHRYPLGGVGCRHRVALRPRLFVGPAKLGQRRFERLPMMKGGGRGGRGGGGRESKGRTPQPNWASAASRDWRGGEGEDGNGDECCPLFHQAMRGHDGGMTGGGLGERWRRGNGCRCC